MQKQIIGEPLVINGRTLSLSRAVRAGDMVFLTGQVPMQDGQVMTWGTVEDQTRAVLDEITNVTDRVKAAIAAWASPTVSPWSRCATTGTEAPSASSRNIAPQTATGMCARAPGPA